MFICLLFAQNLFGQTSWTTSSAGIVSGFRVNGITVLQSKMYAVGSKTNIATIYQSSNNGSTWTVLTTTGLENASYDYKAICTVGNALLLSARDGVGNPLVFKSIDYGSTWTLSDTGLSGFAVDYLTATTSGIVFASKSGGTDIYKSSNSGGSWSLVTTTGFTAGTTLGAICAHGNDLYLSGWGDFMNIYIVYKSTDNGSSWVRSSSGISINFTVYGYASSSVGIYATGYDVPSNGLAGMYLSTDNGASWTLVTMTGLGGYDYFFQAMCAIGSDLVLSTVNWSDAYMIFRSTITTPVINGREVVDVNVFPNPAKDVITINPDNLGKEYQVLICDLTGNTVLTSANESTIDISSLKNGMYVVKVIDDTKTGVTRIVKQ